MRILRRRYLTKFNIVNGYTEYEQSTSLRSTRAPHLARNVAGIIVYEEKYKHD